MKKYLMGVSIVSLCTMLSYGCSTKSNNSSDSGVNTPSEVTTSAVPFTGAIPIDPSVMKGKFSNGVQYLIRKNTKPEKRAEIRLVINAGSVLEDESQLGFAHFAEHMAFNGTEDFKKQEIIEYVESIGMKFGAHLNAHTSFDETVYKLQVPTDDIATIEKGIHILENWAHKISFEPEEIDKERGVVIEELRSSQGANKRIMNKQLPVLFKDSQYAKRLPIGKKDIIANGKHEDLIRFYKDWYRPELMSVIAVGDFEPAQIHALFEEYFAGIKAQNETAKPRPTFTIPDNTEPYISIETDPELVRTIANIQIKQDLFEPITYEGYRESLKHNLYIGMLNSRFYEYVRKPDASIIGGSARFRRSFGDKSMFSMAGAVKPMQVQSALRFFLSEVKRVSQHGFSESEFERQKAAILNQYDKVAKEVNNIPSRGLAQEYVRHFMKSEGIPGVVHENEIAEFFVPTITLAEVNALSQTWLTKANRLIAISGPDSEKEHLPTSEQVLAIWDEIESQSFADYQDTLVPEQLMTPPSVIGSVVDKQHDAELDFHTWTLSNGVKVLLKKTDFKEDAIEFYARSNGGYSLANTETLKQTMFAPHIASIMGINGLSVSDLSKFKKGKSFKLNAKIDARGQSLIGGSSVKDIGHLMQLLHLRFQAPHIDQAAFATFIQRATPFYENRLNNPDGVFGEALRKKQYGNDPRSIKVDAAVVNAQSLDASLDFFHQRFSNAKNFNFVFVGNLDLDEMETLLSTYVATLPAKDPKEDWKKLPDLRTKGKLSLTVEKGLEPKARVVMRLYGDALWSELENRKFSTLEGVLSTILRERIREEKGGVYGVRVNANFSREDDKYSVSISFTCDPVRVDELTTEIKAVFAELQKDEVEEKYVLNYIKQKLKSREVSKKTNGFWRNLLTWIAEPDYTPLSFAEYDALLNSMSTAHVQEAAKQYLNFDDSLIATLMPEVQNVDKLKAQ